jgi:hypothetical protein
MFSVSSREVIPMDEVEQRSLVEAYLKAFKERHLEECVSYFDEDAELQFGPATLGLGRFHGKGDIEKWHRDRFEAGAQIVKVESIQVKDDQVRVNGVISSPRLKAVRIDDLRGWGNFVFAQGKFKQLRLGLRTGYRFHI